MYGGKISNKQKIVHMGGGLGNQMINYTIYIAAKKANPDSMFYLEMLAYFISEFDEVCCQCNGYELEWIFGIKKPIFLISSLKTNRLKL